MKQRQFGFPRGVFRVSQVLAAVGCGVDIFDTAYAALATQAGYALTFPIDEGEGPATAQGASAGSGTPSDLSPEAREGQEGGRDRREEGELPGVLMGSDDTKINVWAEGYRRDPGPLLQGCRCFACRQHSRAYVHHLLMSHEMLAHVLLDLHNTHHMLRFFQAIRYAIQRGKLADLQRRLSSLRPAH